MVRAIGHRTWLTLRKRAGNLSDARLVDLSPILVIAPHQDDETLGCGGLLATAAQRGLRPRVAFLTDGSASHRGSPSWPAERLAAARRREAIQALAVLGVEKSDIRFLAWSDAQPHVAGEAAYAATLQRLNRWARTFAPRSLWSPWPGEHHCDHAAAAGLAEGLARRLSPAPNCMDYLVWGWSDNALARSPDKAWALDCPQTTTARRRALSCHRTQMTNLIVDADASFRIPPRLAALTERPTEIYLERT
jgi:LmbE family N-acetylglucosaminyl deacetylase